MPLIGDPTRKAVSGGWKWVTGSKGSKWYQDPKTGRWREDRNGNLGPPSNSVAPPVGSTGIVENPGGLRDRPGGHPVVSSTTGRPPMDVRALQKFLRSKGYNLQVTGRNDQITRSAAENWRQGPKLRNPGQWNNGKARANAIDVVARAEVERHRDPNPPTPTPRVPAADTTTVAATGQQPQFTLPGFGGNPNVGQRIPLSLAKQGARPITGDYANQMAGLEYDPQIHELGVAQARQPAQQAQALHDIGGWYGQVMAAQKTAGVRDAAIGRAGMASISDASQGILSSLGGGANPGAGVVGAAGQEALGGLAAGGAAQNEYNADMAPLFASERAGQLSGERARQTQLRQDQMMKMLELRGARGQSQGAHQYEIDQYNNQLRDSRLDRNLGIRSANNNLSQQRFGNKMGIFEADIASAGLGVDIQNAQSRAYAAAHAHPGKPTGWAALKPKDRQNMTAGIVTSVKAPNGAWRMGPGRTWQRVLGLVQAQGLDPSTPAGITYLQGLGRVLGIVVGPKGNIVSRVPGPNEKPK